MALFYLGAAAARAGRREEALDWLGQAVTAGQGPEDFRTDKLLDPLRSDPRFVALVERASAKDKPLSVS